MPSRGSARWRSGRATRASRIYLTGLLRGYRLLFVGPRLASQLRMKLDDARKNGNDDDAENEKGQIVFDDWHVAKVKTRRIRRN